MFEPIRISPSILSADFLKLGDEVHAIARAGADWAHVDVMDGHFVPNLTIGVPVAAQLTAQGALPLDVHLMISNPLVQLPWYLELRPHMVTVHWEAFDPACPECDAQRAADLIHGAGAQAAVALKPDTPTAVLADTIGLWDMVLVMSVFPGFSGQAFIESTPGRVAEVVHLARAAGVSPLIQVDGGIGPRTAPLVAAAGADVLVAGNAVYKATDYAQAIEQIREAAAHAAEGAGARG